MSFSGVVKTRREQRDIPMEAPFELMEMNATQVFMLFFLALTDAEASFSNRTPLPICDG
jgi:hypothetical protein